MKSTAFRVSLIVLALVIGLVIVWPKHAVPEFLTKSAFKLTKAKDSDLYEVSCDEVEQIKALLQQNGYSSTMDIDADTPDGKAHTLTTFSSGLNNIEIEVQKPPNARCTMKF